MSKILLAALLSSLLCVLWTATSWLALPWHDAAFRDFHDESAVATAIKGNAEDQLRRRNEKSGVFLLPRNALLGTPAPQPTEIVIAGIDKQQVGQVAANIRGYRPPEPYKGKGVRYLGEYVAKKEGKKK